MHSSEDGLGGDVYIHACILTYVQMFDFVYTERETEREERDARTSMFLSLSLSLSLVAYIIVSASRPRLGPRGL